jgi:hypothetical protein
VSLKVSVNPNLQAVYAPRGIITSAKFARIAAQAGQVVRFLAFGVFAIPENFRGANSPCETGLLCGWPEPGFDVTREFDAAGDVGDRNRLESLLKDGQVCWVELYVNAFDYKTEIQRKPRDQARIDGSVPPEYLPALTAAKARYIFHNKSRRKTSQSFMHAILRALAQAEDGIVANYARPSR